MRPSEMRELARLIAVELMKLKGEAPESLEEWISAKDAAKYMGCSTKTIYNNISEIPHEKKGKRLYFRRSALDSMIIRR